MWSQRTQTHLRTLPNSPLTIPTSSCSEIATFMYTAHRPSTECSAQRTTNNWRYLHVEMQDQEWVTGLRMEEMPWPRVENSKPPSLRQYKSAAQNDNVVVATVLTLMASALNLPSGCFGMRFGSEFAIIAWNPRARLRGRIYRIYGKFVGCETIEHAPWGPLPGFCPCSRPGLIQNTSIYGILGSILAQCWPCQCIYG